MSRINATDYLGSIMAQVTEAQFRAWNTFADVKEGLRAMLQHRVIDHTEYDAALARAKEFYAQ